MDEYVHETISITYEIPTSERATFEMVMMTILKRVFYDKVGMTILKMVAFERVGMIVSERVEMVVHTTFMTICEDWNMLRQHQHAPCMKDHDRCHIPLTLCLYHSSLHLCF